VKNAKRRPKIITDEIINEQNRLVEPNHRYPFRERGPPNRLRY